MNTIYRNDSIDTLVVHDSERGLIAGFHLPCHINRETGELLPKESADFKVLDVTDYIYHNEDVPSSSRYHGFRDWDVVFKPEDE